MKKSLQRNTVCANPVAGYGTGLTGGRSTSSIAGSPLSGYPARGPALAVSGRWPAAPGQQSDDREKNRLVLRGNSLERAQERELKFADTANSMKGSRPEELSSGHAEGASELLEYLERRELLAPFDSADIGKIHPASDPLGQLPLGEPLPEPEAPETLSEGPLE